MSDFWNEIKKKYHYDALFPCHGELTCARKDEQWFHILHDGQPAYPERYDYVDIFSKEGLARVRKDNEWFHILHNGQPAYPERYDYVSIFSKGLARVQKDGKWFSIRPDGRRAD